MFAVVITTFAGLSRAPLVLRSVNSRSRTSASASTLLFCEVRGSGAFAFAL